MRGPKGETVTVRASLRCTVGRILLFIKPGQPPF